MNLPAAVDGERHQVNERSGPLSYYVAGSGTPMVLLHSINAAASAYEVRPVFERMKQHYRVFAPDLPGFGFSDRSKRRYDVELYTNAVLDMLDVVGEEQPKVPVDALALSLSSEFLARAANLAPDRFRTLTFVTPTGFSRGSEKMTVPGQTREMRLLSGILEFPLWRSALYNALVSRGSIRYFLKRTYGGPEVDEGMVDYDYLASHQPGAANAPYSFLSGRLFSRDTRLLYEKLSVPVWVPHGTRGDFKDFSGAGWTRALEHWRFQPFDTGALVHYERPEKFFESFDRHLGS
ncbi:MAG: alpha/beta hydrolase [Myxococcota bacterium]